MDNLLDSNCHTGLCRIRKSDQIMTPRRIERIIISLTVGLIIGCISLIGCIASGQDTARLSPPQPPIPALPIVIGRGTNTEGPFKVLLVREAYTNTPPAALPVSVGAPHHYYGIVEFKRTKDGRETENDVFYFGLYPNEEAFQKSHGVGNTKFNRKFKAVFRYPSELPMEATCVWQRSDGAGP